MSSGVERSWIHVEGEDDQHTLVHLLIHEGIDYDSKPWAENYPEFKAANGVDNLLSLIPLAIRTATKRSVGFVIDANSNVQDRWNKIVDILHTVDVNTPEHIPQGGFIGESSSYAAKIGVWIMPDNKRDGALEIFLESLIDENDKLIDHAKESTAKAKQLGAEFRETDTTRAVIRAWLAWQEEPGHPYGRAIQKRYFTESSEVSNLFVHWFRQLFDIP